MLNEIYQYLDPIAFSLGPVVVRWYGLGYVLGFIFGALVIYRTAKRWKTKVDLDSLSVIMICVVIGIILGARIGYILFYGNGYYFEHPLAIFAFSEGGMSFHGGLMGALIAGIVAARITRIPYLTLADMAVVAAPIGMFLVRCANFINGELWGAPTDAPWGVVFGGAAGTMPRHPSQLYEAILEGLVIFCVLYALSRKTPPRPRGTFLGTFLVLYGLFRFLIEFVREPDAQLGYLWGGWLTMGQLLSTPLFVVGVCLVAFALRKRLPQQGLAEEPAADEAAEGADDEVAWDKGAESEAAEAEGAESAESPQEGVTADGDESPQMGAEDGGESPQMGAEDGGESPQEALTADDGESPSDAQDKTEETNETDETGAADATSATGKNE